MLFRTRAYFCIVAGTGCTAYDVIINPTFFKSLEGRQILLGFLITVILEGLEHKNEIQLNRGKNKILQQ